MLHPDVPFSTAGALPALSHIQPPEPCFSIMFNLGKSVWTLWLIGQEATLLWGKDKGEGGGGVGGAVSLQRWPAAACSHQALPPQTEILSVD